MRAICKLMQPLSPFSPSRPLASGPDFFFLLCKPAGNLLSLTTLLVRFHSSGFAYL